MSAMDCKVAILDPSRSFKKAEHHVKSSDMRSIHEDWRIGTRHIIGGLQSSRMKHLNGLAACVRPWECAFRNVFGAFVQRLFSSKVGNDSNQLNVLQTSLFHDFSVGFYRKHQGEHRRYGHPCFVPKPESDDPKLRLCVRWENPQDNSNGALLLEPRFLSPCVQQPRSEPSEGEAKETKVPSEPVPDNTLLTAKRRSVADWAMSCKEGTGSLRAIDEIEPTICHLSNVPWPS